MKGQYLVNKLIGRFVYETFVFNKVAQMQNIEIGDFNDFAIKYRDTLKTDLYASVYNEYYKQFEESLKTPRKAKKGGKK